MVDSDFSTNTFKFLIDFFRRHQKTILLVTIVAIISIAGTILVVMLIGPQNGDYYLSSHGNIHTLGVEAYWDSACENVVEQISWDVIEPGETVNTTFFLKSVSNSPITLGVNLTDWEPVGLSNYIDVSWDYDGLQLNPSKVIPVTLMLSASSSEEFVYYLVDNEIQNFDVNIHFFGSA